jgi:maleylacetoacetate isomerase
MKLYDYFRSSAAYRVRIALNLKGIAWEPVPVHLTRDGGEQRKPDYAAINPQKLIPAIDVDGRLLTQSLAIIEYLDETRPEPPLLPADAAGRARVRALALAIACDIHPINNLRVLDYLTGTLRVGEHAKLSRYRHWVAEGFDAIERLLAAIGLNSVQRILERPDGGASPGDADGGEHRQLGPFLPQKTSHGVGPRWFRSCRRAPDHRMANTVTMASHRAMLQMMSLLSAFMVSSVLVCTRG